MKSKLNVGVIGLGRLGQVYAADLAHLVPNANLVAVADLKTELAQKFANDYQIPKWYGNHHEIINDKEIDAIVVISSTSAHKEIVIEAAKNGKAVFCEKPISLTLENAKEMADVIKSTGAFLQMAFQRRFDRGYAAALKKIDEGVIGEPVLLVSISRDPSRPPLEFCDPTKSGGMIADMGAHDFDVCRMFMGEVKSVYSVGGALAYPEMKEVGDIDNAIVSVTFESGKVGHVNLSRNAIFGYDIRTEIWGTKGSLQVGYFRETPLLVMVKEGITHDVVPHFMERFELAYLAQIRNFVDNVLHEKEPAIKAEDAIAALKISLAATKSHKENRVVEVKTIV
ncbi:Gfo/Idh/MocA family oxidoreductase [candidate division KSB1 bacterium]|nr:Gfo/Idh/MocA family oxidoreductase [candidate division KSB1 bacterium]